MAFTHHYLKILPPYYDAVERGLKTFEVRFNDRNFKVGDIIHLQEYGFGYYSGRVIIKEICYILDDSRFCKDGFVVIGFRDLKK